jgi:regulator of sirC expression with transglutaminase-like and TPR domain
MDPADRLAELIDCGGAPIPLDEAAALIGAAFDPRCRVDGVLAQLDGLARQCDPTFESILQQMFGSGRLRGNTADYGDPRNSYLHEVLARGVGIPITLGVCAIEVGRRLGVAVQGIGLPGHFVVECGGRFADPFHGAATYAPDEIEPEWRRITGASMAFDLRMLAPSPNRAILLRMLNNLKQTFVAMDDPVPLSVLAKLRGAFPELRGERAEHARWLRHWN